MTSLENAMKRADILNALEDARKEICKRVRAEDMLDWQLQFLYEQIQLVKQRLEAKK